MTEIEITGDDFEIEHNPLIDEDYQKFCIIIQYVNENDLPLAESIQQKILSDQLLRKNLDARIKDLEWRIEHQKALRWDEAANHNLRTLEELKNLRDETA